MDGRVDLLKKPIPACQFVELPEYKDLLASPGQQTTLILGHTRLPTKGDPACERNNHPIQAGPILGVHNGQIKNDDALFAKFGYPRQAEVDSEIIFRMLAATSPWQTPGQYLQEIKPHLELMEGQFTFLSVDCRRPGQLLVLKHNNPLCMHYQAEWNALVFSSRYIFLRKAFGRSIVAEALEHGRLMLYDALSIGERCGQPVETLPIFNDAAPWYADLEKKVGIGRLIGAG